MSVYAKRNSQKEFRWFIFIFARHSFFEIIVLVINIKSDICCAEIIQRKPNNETVDCEWAQFKFVGKEGKKYLW